MRVELKPRRDLSAAERQAIAALGAAVYPPETRDRRSSRRIAWTETDRIVPVADPGGSPVSMAGLLVRPARHDRKPVRIGGLGNVKTHPEARRQGYAEAALRESRRFLQEQDGLDFALLFCRAHNVPFYGKRGWQGFRGAVLVAQPQGAIRFTAYEVMCQDLERPAPKDGTLDLCGLPW